MAKEENKKLGNERDLRRVYLMIGHNIMQKVSEPS